jgi:glycosyltransferase involved in cell wall biosynthesis
MGKRFPGRKKKINLGIIEQEVRLGGVQYTTLILAKFIPDFFIKPTVICPEIGELTQLCQRENIPIEIIPRKRFGTVSRYKNGSYSIDILGILLNLGVIILSSINLAWHLKRRKYDVLITKGLFAHFYGGIAAKLLGMPCIWHVQEEVNLKTGGGIFKKVLNWGALIFASAIVVDARALQRQFDGNKHNLSKLRVIYNGVDLDKYQPSSLAGQVNAKIKLGLPPGAFVVGQSGRIIPPKGQKILFHAFEILAPQMPDLVLVFIGAPLFWDSTYFDELQHLANQSRFHQRILFSGFLPEVFAGLQALDLFVQASIETDSPLAIMEAMACGLPVIASDVEGTKELIDHLQTGCLFKHGDVEALAEAIKRMVQEPDFRQKVALAGLQKAKERYSTRAYAGSFAQLVFELANKSAS